MSNFTDFFPAASGGGGGLFYSSPRQMPCSWTAQNAIYIKAQTLTGTHTDTTAIFRDTISRIGGFNKQFLTADLNTYQELCNITNANGGVFHGAAGPLSTYLTGTAVSIQEYRITIDGTEYDIVANTGARNASAYVRATIGNFPEGLAAQSTTNTMQYSPYNSYYSYAEDSATGQAFTVKPFRYYSVDYKMFVPVNLNLMGGVEFKETLKVELKTNNIATGGSTYDVAFSLQSLY